jgi:hypothetical protein
MRRFAIICCCAAAVVGCAKTETKAPAAASVPPPPPPALTLADVAGKWSVKGMNEARDSTLVTYQLTATADTSGWTITFPNRKQPIPARVAAVAGDSVVIDAGPYESVLRRGVQVTTHGVMRLQNGKLVGLTVAHYKTARPDSVRRIPLEGTRTP